MGKHAGAAGITAFWAKIKATFGASVSVSGATISLKNKADTPVILSQATIPDATTSVAGVMSAADKVKIDGVAVGANKTVVDATLSATSTNPVQNKAVNDALSGKLSTGGNAASATKLATARNIVLSGDVTGSASFDGTANAALAATLTEMTASDVNAVCTPPLGSVEALSEVTPVGILIHAADDLNPALLYGGTWTVKSIVGSKQWKRVA